MTGNDWIAVGVRVRSDDYGDGVITNVSRRAIWIYWDKPIDERHQLDHERLVVARMQPLIQPGS